MTKRKARQAHLVDTSPSRKSQGQGTSWQPDPWAGARSHSATPGAPTTAAGSAHSATPGPPNPAASSSQQPATPAMPGGGSAATLSSLDTFDMSTMELPQDSNAPLEPERLMGRKKGKAKANNTIPPSARMQEFQGEWAAQAQRAWLEREKGPPPHPICASCRSSIQGPDRQSVYRCYDCFDPPELCLQCAIDTHQQNPFHRFDVWETDKKFWHRQCLGDVPGEKRLELMLGHHGFPCPINPGPNGLRNMTIVHTHGIHTFPVRFCHCAEKDTDRPVSEAIQLIRYGLWPASWKIPQSAFTISSLRDYQLLSWQSQISAHDYHLYLSRSTDNVAPETVPNRERELLTASRELSFARIKKRAGVNPAGPLLAGILAVLCAACPQPGINMDTRYERTGRPTGLQYLDALYGNIDGNFHSTENNVRVDKKDQPLTKNGAFYANEDEYNEYQRARRGDPMENTTCNKFGAMGYSRYGGRVTGLLGMSCSRHMFAMPLGAVDMEGGEAYAYADFVNCSALRKYMGLLMLFLGYDIMCQYILNFSKRMAAIKKDFGHFESIPKAAWPIIIALVGKFHLAAHIAACRFKYSYNYMPGAALTDGEGSERGWPTMNHLAVRTKEMTTGHRHDVTNDVLNDVNVRKLHNLPNDLAKRYVEAKKRLADVQQHMEETEKNFSVEELSELKKEEGEFLENVVRIDRHKDLQNPYDLKIDRGLTTKELLADIEKSETSTDGTAAASLGALDVIYEGIELQRLRDATLDAIEDGDDSTEALSNIEKAQSELQERMQEWVTSFNNVMQPALDVAAHEVLKANSDLAGPDHAFPKREEVDMQPKLTKADSRAEKGLPPLRTVSKKTEMWSDIYALQVPLPSTFDNRIIRQPAVSDLVKWERKVWEGHANDALNEVRTHIVTSEMLKIKKMDTWGKGPTTRVSLHIGRKHGQVEAAAQNYRRAWCALVALGMEEDGVKFPRLKKKDIRKFAMSSGRESLGQSREKISWIWENMVFADEDKDGEHKEFYNEVHKVHWFRSSALYARWEEEVNLLDEEMRRTIRYYAHYEGRWLRRAEDEDAVGNSAMAAYARKQAYRYTRLGEKCRAKFLTFGLNMEEEAEEARNRSSLSNDVD